MTDTTACKRCGQPHERCTAHNRAGHPCRSWPEPDQTVCRLHGGKAPQAIAKAEERRRVAEAGAQVMTLGLSLETTPDQALLDELYRTAGEVAWLDVKVRELDTDDLVWGVTDETKKGSGEFPGTDVTSSAKPNVWYQLWVAARDRLVKVAEACKKANIEERRIQLAEDQGRLIAGAIQQILTALQLTDEQQQRVPQIVPAILRQLTPAPVSQESA